MKLFKNVDIVDLESILKNGIQSMDVCRNNNWEDSKRVNNPTDVVYLFDPTGKLNSFPKYGAALIEVDIDDAKLAEMVSNDAHRGEYDEYVAPYVPADRIQHIYIPDVFKNSIPQNLLSEIDLCGIEANVFDPDRSEESFRRAITEKELNRFAETAEVNSVCAFNYFRGISEKNTMIDLYDVRYIF